MQEKVQIQVVLGHWELPDPCVEKQLQEDHPALPEAATAGGETV